VNEWRKSGGKFSKSVPKETQFCDQPQLVKNLTLLGNHQIRMLNNLIVTCGIGLQTLLLTCDWSGHSLAVSQSGKNDDSRKEKQ